MLATALLLGLCLAATVTDVARRRIYNWTTYPGLVAALAINAAGWLVESRWPTADPSWQQWVGWLRPNGLTDSLLGLAACGLPMIVCFVLFRLGGGDVKLLAMVGAFLGLQKGVEALLWTFVLGGALVLILLTWRVGPWTLLGWGARHVLWLLRLGSWGPLSPEERGQLQAPLFLAPCVLGAVLIARFELLEQVGL